MQFLRATLARLYADDDQGTLGNLEIPALSFRCITLELPWRDNLPGLSCIPEGEYEVHWTLSPRLKHYTYEILRVPKRGGIRMHAGCLAGNVEKGLISHSLGCPLLGKVVGAIKQQRAILVSRPTVANMERLLEKRPFILTITSTNKGERHV